jgi:predicted nucleic acid-binding protein
MNFVIDGGQIDSVDFSGASIYLDACFILAYFDKSDHRRHEVARALDVWADYEDVTLGMSNHTVAEVINRLFQMIILGSLQVYHEKNKLLNHTRDGYDKLSTEEKEKLVNLDSARFLYGLAKKEEILRLYKKEVNVNITDLIKLAKMDEEKRSKLDVFYNLAVDKFELFIYSMRNDLGFRFEILGSNEDPHYYEAIINMKTMQMDITDSFHLAIAQSNNYNYLSTLDSDFIHNFYPNTFSFSTKIIRIA